MNIRWIVIFAEVAVDGSFIRAATRLNVSQPWLSAQVQRLEAECGVKLFERLNTGLELTPDGRKLLPYAEQVASGSRQFRDIARTMGDVRNKTVRIGSFHPMLQISALNRLNGSFAIRYPQYSIVADTAPLEDMLDRLSCSQFDLVAAITPLPDREDIPLETILLEPVRPFLLAPQGAVPELAGRLDGVAIAAAKTAAHPTLMKRLIEPLVAAGADIRNAPENDRAALEHLVRTRAVIALMLQGEPEDYDGDADLVAVPLPEVGARHVLLRYANRGLARAAERYWTNALALSSAPPEAVGP